ncbi:MAG: HAMP domain-containing protein [Betaproteobacteria bacterium]|nr:HAMP domain-containing protein [Betaproteobacteria bacterium]
MRYLITSALVISLALLVILIRSLSNSDFISSETFQLLLKINLAFVVLLFIFIALQVYRLFKEVKKEVTGSRLTLRLVISYSVMIIVPLMVLYFVSVNFLTKSIESWFNVRVESALESGLNIGQKTLDILRKDVELKSRSISYSLSNSKINEFNPILSDLTEKFDIYDAMIIDDESQILAISSRDNIEIDAVFPDEKDLILANTGFHGKIDITQENIIYLKTYQPYFLIDDKIQKKFYLILTQKIPESISQAALSVESVFEDYQALTFSRNSLKVIYQITLSIILFLAILLSISLALYFSRRFTMPLSILSEATQSIAKGNFKKKIPEQGKDELGMLVRSFNIMTTKLETANKTLELNRQRIESSRNFLESIINNMSSGIIVIDPKNNIRLTNKLASKLLGFNLELLNGQRFNQILEHGSQFEEIVTLVNKSKINYKEKALILKFKRRILSIQLTEEDVGRNKNKIIIIDDISEITAAQRNEAWSEVARRLAHEIKNPLTPIQLSAERIDHKFSKQLEKKDRAILSDITKTIVNQVDAIKKMVNEFTEYSRSPELTKTEINLVDLINELVNLFQKEDLTINILSSSKKINFICDEIKIRQVFVNLINNAYEAKKDDSACEIDIRLRKTKSSMIINFIDNGSGINDDIDIFQPYVTTKKTGTGLGLAVVKKIIDEHDGSISIKNNKLSGANVEIQFSI